MLGVTAAVAMSAGLGLPTTPAQEVATAGITPDRSFCGTMPITLGIELRLGGDAWSKASLAAVRSEAAKCQNVKQIALAGGTTADIESLVARGANAIVVVPGGGKAELRALQFATGEGVTVVPWGADPGGVDGNDYVQYVDWNPTIAGTYWARWMVDALHGRGNVVFAGGPARNPGGRAELESIVEVFAKHPGMTLLTGTATFGVTDWNPATAQKLAAAYLARYPKIDGVIANSGTDALAVIRAFQAVDRRLVPTATLDSNGLTCLYTSTRKSNPGFQLATFSSRNWLGRIAVRKAIAAAEGIANHEPARITLPFYDDTLHGRVGRCDPKVGADFSWSENISPATIAKFGKPTG